MGFYNPYMQGPDLGGGMQDLLGQIMQIVMMKKIMGQQGGQRPPQQPWLPNGGQMPQPGLQGPMAGGPTPPQVSPQGSMPPQGAPQGSPMGGQMGGQPQIPPELMQMIMQIMSQMR